MMTFLGFVAIGLLAALIGRIEHLAGQVKALRSDIDALIQHRRQPD